MKLGRNITVRTETNIKRGALPGKSIYLFFMIHMLAFGGSGFFMAYADHSPPVLFLYAHGGIAILVYTVFYLTIFGVDEVKWMFINAALAAAAIYSQIGWMLSLFGKQVSDYPLYVHVIPFLYFVLYTFLLRQALLDFTNSRNNPLRKKVVEGGYVVISTLFYIGSYMVYELPAA